MQNIVDKNRVILIGKVESENFEEQISHDIKYYLGHFFVERMSGTIDRIPIRIREEVLKAFPSDIFKEKVQLIGEIVTKNDINGRLNLAVQVRNIIKQTKDVCDKNEIVLEATICKKNYRETPFGRQITDLMLASNRNYGKTAYVPTITWGYQAVALQNVDVGTKISVKGRLQSRKYMKKYSDDNWEEKETYELSVSEYKIISQK